MYFASDNTGPAHPKVMEALVAANEGYATPYGDDSHTQAATEAIREVFEAPEAAVFLVATGTAANALSLATLTRPWQGIYCSRIAHIHVDECGAVEQMSGGAKLILVDDLDGKMAPETLDAQICEGLDRGLHYVQPGPVSITQVTERGAVHSLDEIRALAEVARAHDLPLHMDGARFANALVALDCTPAEMSWKLGVDALSFGATKNGAMGVEAVVLFDPDKAREFELRRKRGAHLFSKGRYLGAQMSAYLADGLWLDLAKRANGAAERLRQGLKDVPGAEIFHASEANMIYVMLPRAAHRRAVAAGAEYFMTLEMLEGGSDEDLIPARLVCDWSAETAGIDLFLEHLRG